MTAPTVLLPLTVVPASRTGVRPATLTVLARNLGFNVRYSLFPFFRRHADRLRARFPEGLELRDAMADDATAHAPDYFLCYEPEQEDAACIAMNTALCGDERSVLCHYEHPISHPFRKWTRRVDLLELYRRFRYVFSNAGLFADGQRMQWVPIWNFIRDFENDEPLVPYAETVPATRRFLAVNPLNTGIQASQERIALIDYFVSHVPDSAVFGAREYFDREPCRRWLPYYGGELPMGPPPYRFTEKVRAFRGFRFMLAIENVFSDGYISEKLGEPLAVLSLPVYFGYPHIERYLPRLFDGGVINAHRYESVASLVDAMRRMSDAEYRRRLDVIREHRDEFLDLTSRVRIWEYMLAKTFDLDDITRSTDYERLNVRLAALNQEPARVRLREAVWSLLASAIEAPEYDRRVRDLAFEPNVMRWSTISCAG